MFDRRASAVEKTAAGTVLRTATSTFDAAGRPVKASTSAPGLGTALPITRIVYDPATGLPAQTQTLDAGGNVTAHLDRTSVTEYDPAADGSCQSTTAGATTTWSYDTADLTSNSGYTYDALGRATITPGTDTETSDGAI